MKSQSKQPSRKEALVLDVLAHLKRSGFNVADATRLLLMMRSLALGKSSLIHKDGLDEMALVWVQDILEDEDVSGRQLADAIIQAQWELLVAQHLCSVATILNEGGCHV